MTVLNAVQGHDDLDLRAPGSLRPVGPLAVGGLGITPLQTLPDPYDLVPTFDEAPAGDVDLSCGGRRDDDGARNP